MRDYHCQILAATKGVYLSSRLSVEKPCSDFLDREFVSVLVNETYSLITLEAFEKCTFGIVGNVNGYGVVRTKTQRGFTSRAMRLLCLRPERSRVRSQAGIFTEAPDVCNL